MIIIYEPNNKLDICKHGSFSPLFHFARTLWLSFSHIPHLSDKMMEKIKFKLSCDV